MPGREVARLKLIVILIVLGLLVVRMGIYVNNTEFSWSQKHASNVKAFSSPITNSLLLNEITVPKPSDWVDYGPILESGPEGSWDFQWAGATPVGVIKKTGTYYFYYGASDGYRSHDGGPRHRAIGVATSQDGIHFTKYSNNPVMTHSPLSGEEEGANSAGINLDTNGDFVLYYGAAKGAGSLINADGRVAVSKNGFDFIDISKVIDHRDSRVYGHGDEIFPVTSFHHDGNWYVYYQPNGGTAAMTLGMAWGPSLENLPNSVKVLDEKTGGKPVGTWGNVIWLAPNKIALFIQRLWWPKTFVEVRTAFPDTPYQLSEPVERYVIPNLKRGTVFLDTECKTWFMYYNDFDRFWDLKLAPAGAPDTTPPTAPTNLSAIALSHDRVELSWGAANDPDTGVVIYNIYRNAVKVGSTKGWAFTDTGLSEFNSYDYSVTAVNFHGTEGPPAGILVTTLADTTPPRATNAISSLDPTQVEVLYSEPVDETSAEKTTNYSITNGIQLLGASLAPDLKTVILTTSEHKDNRPYQLEINNVLDRAATPNPIASDTQVIYTYSSIEGLAAYWNFDQGKGTVATDVSGYGNNGIIKGAAPRKGIINGALYFDGNDDHVVVRKRPPLKNLTDDSFSLTAWVKPEDTPPKNNSYGILLRVAGHPAQSFGLLYISNRKYQGQLHNKSGSVITLKSRRIKPDSWHHVAMVVDDGAKQMHLYVDGEPVRTSPKSYAGKLLDLDEEAGKSYVAGEYYIGSSKPDQGAGSFYTRHFRGMIDDVRIYNRALSASEIQNLFGESIGN